MNSQKPAAGVGGATVDSAGQGDASPVDPNLYHTVRMQLSDARRRLLEEQEQRALETASWRNELDMLRAELETQAGRLQRLQEQVAVLADLPERIRNVKNRALTGLDVQAGRLTALEDEFAKRTAAASGPQSTAADLRTRVRRLWLRISVSGARAERGS